MTRVIKDDHKYYQQIFLEKALISQNLWELEKVV